MANRPVFILNDKKPFYNEVNTEFQYFSGFALSQQQKCIESLHSSFRDIYPDKKILEISSKSLQDLGIRLSAFNLLMKLNNKKYPIENIFQSSKVFESGGPYLDLISKTPKEAKRDLRLRQSGRLLKFHCADKDFPLNPSTSFYNWIYINALYQNEDLAKQVIQYDAFTDIAFNPKKSINCQAIAVAIFVSLYRQNLLLQAMESFSAFVSIVYDKIQPDTVEQISLF